VIWRNSPSILGRKVKIGVFKIPGQQGARNGLERKDEGEGGIKQKTRPASFIFGGATGPTAVHRANVQSYLRCFRIRSGGGTKGANSLKKTQRKRVDSKGSEKVGDRKGKVKRVGRHAEERHSFIFLSKLGVRGL